MVAAISFRSALNEGTGFFSLKNCLINRKLVYLLSKDKAIMNKQEFLDILEEHKELGFQEQIDYEKFYLLNRDPFNCYRRLDDDRGGDPAAL